MKTTILCLMLFALFLASCGPAATPLPTPAPTSTPAGHEQPYVPPPTSTPAVITLPQTQGQTTPPPGTIVIPPGNSTTGSDNLPSIRPLQDTWLKVLGAPENDLAGTSAVRLLKAATSWRRDIPRAARTILPSSAWGSMGRRRPAATAAPERTLAA